jgi:hypothetical protein
MDTAPKLTGIRVTANPRSDLWQTPIATSEFSVLLIGWIANEMPVEAGVPMEAMQVLSACLTRLAVVTFLAETPASTQLAPNQWQNVRCGWAACLSEKKSLFSSRRVLPLIATQDSSVAQELFRSSAFDWNQQRQIALLSEPGRPPAVDYDLVERFLNRASIADAIRDLSLLGVLYPAVDGDFAALVSSDAGFTDDFQRELRLACQTSQLTFGAISEEEFRRTQWVG